jgi:hypothetical protein
MTVARAFSLSVGACLVFGLIYRLAPLALGPEAMAQFFITEDGYLMLTVARNLAIGNGLSVSDGMIPTNGVQPLATLLYAVPYWLTGGDKVASLAGVILIMTAWSVGAAFAIQRFARGILGEEPPIWSWAAAALWFVGPLALLHSMNALETGLYIGMVAATMAFFGHVVARGGRYTRADQVILGCLCGATFLARIDGAMLVTAIFAVRFVQVQWTRQASFREAVAEALPPGIISLLFAAPWLVHNQVFFGSIMPISGPAQSLSAEFGGNLEIVPAKLFETMLPMLPIPTSLERSSVAIAAAAIVVLGVLAWFLWRTLGRRHPQAPMIAAYTLYGGGLVFYYGAFFGAGHFLSRYLAPLGPLLVTAAVYVALDLVRRLPAIRGGDLARVAGTGALALALLLLVRLALPGVKEQGHFHVVGWVERNVGEETWVGAVQTGTLGYWHDRTINLDGKVNPEALAARRRDGDVLNYVVASEIDVIADWVGMAGWVERGNERFAEVFEVVVADRAGNLSVLRRRGADARI